MPLLHALRTPQYFDNRTYAVCQTKILLLVGCPSAAISPAKKSGRVSKLLASLPRVPRKLPQHPTFADFTLPRSLGDVKRGLATVFPTKQPTKTVRIDDPAESGDSIKRDQTAVDALAAHGRGTHSGLSPDKSKLKPGLNKQASKLQQGDLDDASAEQDPTKSSAASVLSAMVKDASADVKSSPERDRKSDAGSTKRKAGEIRGRGGTPSIGQEAKRGQGGDSTSQNEHNILPNEAQVGIVGEVSEGDMSNNLSTHIAEPAAVEEEQMGLQPSRELEQNSPVLLPVSMENVESLDNKVRGLGVRMWLLRTTVSADVSASNAGELLNSTDYD